MKISPAMENIVHLLALGLEGFREASARMLDDLDDANAHIDLTRYEKLPASFFDRSMTWERQSVYEVLLEDHVREANEQIDALLKTELECKAYCLTRNDKQALAECEQRLQDIATLADEFDPASEKSAWFKQTAAEILPALTARYKATAAGMSDAGFIETCLIEQNAIAYTEAAKAFVSHSDLHAAMIVLHLSENPHAKGDAMHLKYLDALRRELRAADTLSTMLERMVPHSKHVDINDFKRDVKLGLVLN